MFVTRPQCSAADSRGAITDILTGEIIDSVTVITSNKGVVRGNHYHKETVQWVYLQSGRLKALTQKRDHEVESRILDTGDLIRTDENERHSLTALTDSVFFVFTRGPRSGKNYEDDTYRLDESLEDPDEPG